MVKCETCNLKTHVSITCRADWGPGHPLQEWDGNKWHITGLMSNLKDFPPPSLTLLSQMDSETLRVADKVDPVVRSLHYWEHSCLESLHLLPHGLQAGASVEQVDDRHICARMRLQRGDRRGVLVHGQGGFVGRDRVTTIHTRLYHGAKCSTLASAAKCNRANQHPVSLRVLVEFSYHRTRMRFKY